jgi:hypothetical protein
MLEKLIQAAIITFLLHLLAAISSNTSIPSKPIPSLSESQNVIPLTTTTQTNITLLPLVTDSDGI